MSTSNTNSLKNAFNGKHNKDKAKTQKNRVFKAFFEAPKTMKMVSVETGIDRANICRYVAKFRKSDNVAEVKKGLCIITKHRAGFLTTNPDQFPKTNQLKMW
jgi:hypothetical protein